MQRILATITVISLIGGCDSSDDDAGPIDDGEVAASMDDGDGTDPTPGGADDTLPPAVGDRLERVLELVNGRPLELAVAVAQRVRDSTDVTFAREESGELAGDLPTRHYDCAGGGSVRSQEFQISGVGLFERLELLDCAFGPVTASASFVVGDPIDRTAGDAPAPDPYAGGDFERAPLHEIESFELRDSRDGRTVTLTGSSGALPLRIDRSYTDSWRAPLRSTDAAPAVAVTDADGTTALTELATAQVFVGGDGGDALDVTLTARLSGTLAGEEGPLSVTTPVAFTRTGVDGDYTAGSLSIEGPGTRRWTLDANNGDATTFQLDVIEDGTTTSYTVPWSTRFDFDRFETTDVDLGF